MYVVNQAGDDCMQKRLENSLIFIWTVSLVATLGSLYFSEVRGYEPCTLCWYQRILMYPIVLISGVALFQKNARIALTLAVFSIVGGSISLYHYGHPKTKFFERQRTGLRECILHGTIHQLSWVHHYSILGTYSIFNHLNHKPFHDEMAEGVEVT